VGDQASARARLDRDQVEPRAYEAVTGR